MKHWYLVVPCTLACMDFVLRTKYLPPLFPHCGGPAKVSEYYTHTYGVQLRFTSHCPGAWE